MKAHALRFAPDADELGQAEGDLRERGATGYGRAVRRYGPGRCRTSRAGRPRRLRPDRRTGQQRGRDPGRSVRRNGRRRFRECNANPFLGTPLHHSRRPSIHAGAKDGRIVNISSLGGRISVPHLLPYGASKFALAGLSQGLRAELSKDGILVTTVLPGLMRTGSPVNAFFKGHHRAEYALFSISDSIPLLSVSAELAAQQIITACRHGDAELVISWPAKLASAFHGLFPGLTVDVLGLANRLLPGPGGVGTTNTKGADSTSAISPSLLTRLSDRAALANNEVRVGKS